MPAQTTAHLALGSTMVVNVDGQGVSSQLVKGNYRFVFGNSDQKRSLLLPQDKEIRITGTELLIRTSEKKSLVYLKKGRAEIYQQGEKVSKLKKKRLYTLTDIKVKKKKIKKDKVKELFTTSLPASLDAIDEKEDEPRDTLKKKKAKKGKGEAPSKKKTKKAAKKKSMTLAQLKKKGALVTVITRSGKKYIGVYKGKGAKTEIITTKGKVTINSADIKVVKPYR